MTEPNPNEFRSGVARQSAIAAFNQILRHYRYIDIEWYISLIRSGCAPPAGPLLLLTVATIDCMGGTAFGFKSEDGRLNSTERFQEACKQILNLNQSQVDLLVNVVRHPMVHAGITEGEISFSAEIIDDLLQQNEFVQLSGDQLHLYVGNLALLVLKGIRRMDDDKEAWVKDRPGEGVNVSKNNTKIINNVKNEIRLRNLPNTGL